MKAISTYALIILFSTALSGLMAQPCNLTNSWGCDCPDGSNDCDLLPDMTVAEQLLLDPSNNPESPGELGVSVSTPNVGYGPLRVNPTDYYLCGTDTIYSPGGYSGTCPDGSVAKQLVKQVIYHKNPDGSMTSWERWAGSMTYHASHGHMHVDDWGIYTLRLPIAGVDPLDWPIVAKGAKLGFCLMDFGSCSYYAGHCVDSMGSVLTTDAPNYGLGGGSYSCGTTNQGISAGWTDIYHYYLDGMQIPIPPTVCNGDYMLVVQIDSSNYFLEQNENNNVMVVPVTLTMQSGFTEFDLNANGNTKLCLGESVELSTPVVAEHYSWSTGDTTDAITVTEAGIYECTVTTNCGTILSNPITIEVQDTEEPIAVSDTICGSGTATLSATGSGEIEWFDVPSGGSMLATGENFTTPLITGTTSYWVQNTEMTIGPLLFSEPHDHSGGSDYSSDGINGYVIFDALSTFTLNSVKVYTDMPGQRTIELRDESGTVLQQAIVTVPAGESRITLNFIVNPGTNLQLGTNTAFNAATLGFDGPHLKRTQNTVTYPYEEPGLFSLNDSPYGTNYYYYFYDWEVKVEDFICSSDREEVEAVVEVCTGIEDLGDLSNIKIHPNPSEGPLTISFESSTLHDYEIRVLDFTGREVYNYDLPAFIGAYNHRLDLTNQAAGIYFAQISADGQTVNLKLVLQ